MPDLGTQTARYVELVPPETLQNDLTKRPPVVLIGGISNDLDCVGTLMQEAAFEGRRITSIAYPESFMGTVTEEFAKACEDSTDYAHHADFFKAAIGNLFKGGEALELWGYSTGAPIVEQILNDPKFQERTANTVLFCPASLVDQSAASLNMGLLNEIGWIKKRFPDLARLVITAGSKKLPEQQYSPLHKRVFEALMIKIRKRFDFWKSSKVKEGGRIMVVSGEKDMVTKSAQAVGQLSIHPQIRVINLPDGYHATPAINAQTVLPSIFKMQQ